jgi:hypothetical protein
MPPAHRVWASSTMSFHPSLGIPLIITRGSNTCLTRPAHVSIPL